MYNLIFKYYEKVVAFGIAGFACRRAARAEFYRITDIDDDERALEVSAVSYLDASENRFGAQVAYEIKPLTAYF